MRYIAAITLLLTIAACGQRTNDSVTYTESSAPLRGEVLPPAEIRAGEYQISGPFRHQNLSVFVIQKERAPEGDLNCLTLEEALKSGTLKIAEKADGPEVNKLDVENSGDRPVYLQAGDTVKGGKQDRTISIDFILPPHSGKTTIDAFCVEPGRWSGRQAMADFPGVDVSLAFGRSEAPIATKEQKLAVRLEKSQAGVWSAGGQITGQVSAGISGDGMATGQLRSGLTARGSSSYVLAVENPEVRKKLEAYETVLSSVVEGKRNLVGVAFSVNGEANTIEIYAASGFFLKLWPKLLRSAALEALTKKAPGEGDKPSQVSDIAKLLDEAGKSEGRMEFLPNNIRVKVYDGEKAALFDTEKDGELLHRQVIKK